MTPGTANRRSSRQEGVTPRGNPRGDDRRWARARPRAAATSMPEVTMMRMIFGRPLPLALTACNQQGG